MARTGPRSEPTTRHPPDAEHLPAPTNTPTTDAGRAGGRPTPPPAADSDVQAAAGASSAAALSFADNLTDIPNGPSSPDDIAPGTRCGSYRSTTEKSGELRAMPRRQLPARGVSPADAGIPAAPAKLPAAPISCTATRPIAGAPGPDHAGDAGQCHPVRCGPVTGGNTILNAVVLILPMGRHAAGVARPALQHEFPALNEQRDALVFVLGLTDQREAGLLQDPPRWPAGQPGHAR